MYENRTEALYVIPINNLGTLIYTHLINTGHSYPEYYRDRILYTIVSDILSDEMGYNLISIDNINPDKLALITMSTDMKIWKDYLWKLVATTITVNLNLLYYVDILVNKGNLYIKLEENVE